MKLLPRFLGPSWSSAEQVLKQPTSLPCFLFWSSDSSPSRLLALQLAAQLLWRSNGHGAPVSRATYSSFLPDLQAPRAATQPLQIAASDTGEVWGKYSNRVTLSQADSGGGGGRWTQTHTPTLTRMQNHKRTPKMPSLLRQWVKAWLWQFCCGVISGQQSMSRPTHAQTHNPEGSPVTLMYSQSLMGPDFAFSRLAIINPQLLSFTVFYLFSPPAFPHPLIYLLSHTPPLPLLPPLPCYLLE